MELTIKQQEGLSIILNRFRSGEKYVTIGGYAGTGKSTLVRFAIEALDVEESKIAYATYTGKAAEVLRKKGNLGAMTLHRLLYDSVPKAGGGFFRKPKSSLNYSIIVVDEVSMVPKTMIDMLLRHKVFIIFLGDPFQLPQIDKNESHDILDHPHIFLDEIMRQAAESEIIQMTLAIRKGQDIPYQKGKEVIVIPKAEFTDSYMLWADQIIVGTNATRTAINNQMRELKGFSGLPQHGEKMICLRNYWDDLSEDGASTLVNGTTGILENPFESFRMAPSYVKMKNHKMETVCGNFIADDGRNTTFHSVELDKHMILTGEKCVDWRESYALGKLRNKIGDIVPREFAFGYAITGHKAQGSEWNKVLVVEESFPYERIEHARWLYTAATRAASRLVLVR